jgi:hypothetical protein
MIITKKECQALQLLLKDIVEITSFLLTSDGIKLIAVNRFYDFNIEVLLKPNYLDTYRNIILQFINHLTTLKMVKEMEIKHIDAFVKLLAERSRLNVDNVN